MAKALEAGLQLHEGSIGRFHYRATEFLKQLDELVVVHEYFLRAPFGHEPEDVAVVEVVDADETTPWYICSCNDEARHYLPDELDEACEHIRLVSSLVESCE